MSGGLAITTYLAYLKRTTNFGTGLHSLEGGGSGDRRGVRPRFRFDLHSQTWQFRHANAALLGHEGMVQHRWPGGFVKHLTTFLDSEIGDRRRQVRRGVKQQWPTGGVGRHR